MDYWDSIWEKMISDSKIKEEYRSAFLLNIFQKMCSKMNKSSEYKSHILNLFRQTFDKAETTEIIVRKEYNISLTKADSKVMSEWLDAYFRKDGKRRSIPLSVKEELFKKQNGLCNACGQPLGNAWNEIHVDHIIPWVLVGDELQNNYQDLCETCNKCKSSKTDYIFKNLLNLT